MIVFKKNSDKYACFNNSYEAPVMYDCITYKSSEAALQAQKTFEITERMEFAKLSADEARKKGKSIKLRDDWQDIKYDVMCNILYVKFKQNKGLMDILLETGSEPLVADMSHIHDMEWGTCFCRKHGGKGKNLLGKALEEVRSKLAIDNILGKD